MQYDLLMEASGAKFVALIGAYDEFAKRGHTAGRLIGTSGGAIVATLIAAGYTAPEMLQLLGNGSPKTPGLSSFLAIPSPLSAQEIKTGTVAAAFRTVDLPFMPAFVEEPFLQNLSGYPLFANLFAFIERGGWYSDTGALSWLRQALDSGQWLGRKRVLSGVTLSQFFAATGAELSLVASDTSEGRQLILNHRTAPDCPLVWAVWMSASIPIVWPPVTWLKEWGRYEGRDISGHMVVNGVWLFEFPIELLISDNPVVTSVVGDKRQDAVLGMISDDTLPVLRAVIAPGQMLGDTTGHAVARNNGVFMLARFVDLATLSHRKGMQEVFDPMTVRLPSGSYGTCEFDMSENRIADLVAAAQQATQDYFEQAVLPKGQEESALRTANDITAAQMLRDCSLPAALVAVLVDPLQSLGFEIKHDRVADEYATWPASAVQFSTMRNDKHERILLHFPASILKQAPEQAVGKEVTNAIAYMGALFRFRTRILYICAEGLNHLPAAYQQIIHKFWKDSYRLEGVFVTWDSLMALKDSSLEEQQGELLKGVLNLEELLTGATRDAFNLGLRLEKLTSEQQATLQEAMLDAFSKSDLRSMVRRAMGTRLDEIAGGNNDAETVFNLLEWAERNGKLNELVEGALRANPGNPSLKKFVASLGG